MSTVRHVAAHEGRHAAAGLLLGLPVREASVMPDVEQNTAGRVTVDFMTLDPAELTDAEARDFAKMIAVGRLCADADEYWPPAWPSKSGKTRDERQLAHLAERLGLDVKGWTRLRNEALELAARPDFRLLRDGLTSLLLRDGAVTADALKKAHDITSGRPAMPTYEAEASSRILKPRGKFALLFDVYAPTRSKPRGKSDVIAQAIAARQQSGQDIPVRGLRLGGAVIGHADPRSFRNVRGMGVFVKGELYTEEPLAIEMLRRLRAGRVRVEYPEDLSTITLHPLPMKAAEPKPRGGELDGLHRLLAATADESVPPPRRPRSPGRRRHPAPRRPRDVRPDDERLGQRPDEDGRRAAVGVPPAPAGIHAA